jgi:hypothetical protein
LALGNTVPLKREAEVESEAEMKREDRNEDYKPDGHWAASP